MPKISIYKLDLEEKGALVIKNNNSYMTIQTKKFIFLDVMNYLAPGFSYAKFLKAYGTSASEGIFPYEYFDSFDKLKETKLPPYSQFFSQLKDDFVCTRAEYAELLQVWEKEGMETLYDFLVWYNDLDTAPGVEAVQKMLELYHNKGIDLFKESVSAPGVARKLIFNSCSKSFGLFRAERL